LPTSPRTTPSNVLSVFILPATNTFEKILFPSVSIMVSPVQLFKTSELYLYYFKTIGACQTTSPSILAIIYELKRVPKTDGKIKIVFVSSK
jgi:hypothetical protein